MSDLCFFCANPATPTSPLIRSASGRLLHAGLEADDGPDPCPPLPQGFGWCGWCNGGFSFGDLAITKGDGPARRYIMLWPDRPSWVERNHDVAAVLNGSDTNSELICGECMSRPPRASLKSRIDAVLRDGPLTPAEITARLSRSTPPSPLTPDQTRLAAVPADGPGLTKPQLMTLWKLSDSSTRHLLSRAVTAGALVVEEQLTTHGGRPQKRYRRR